ncbi:SAM-dependent methyltransferase [Methanobacterium sp. ACI-7]|uniref:SAM-dependent methyltransferase n=1 Tax=Methanobacterium sp. ACI-7 TaxID=3240853 RepID=UPI0039C3D996
MISLFSAIIISILVIALLTVWIMWSTIIGAGFEPTSKRKVSKMLQIAEIDSNDVLYDLGSGDGRIVAEAIKKYNARAVGIEADPIRVMWSRFYLFFSRLKNSKIIWGNFFNHDISDATAVTLFLGDEANQKLKSKLLKELKPGTPVVSYVWTFDGWMPVKVDKENRIFLYVIGRSDRNRILDSD